MAFAFIQTYSFFVIYYSDDADSLILSNRPSIVVSLSPEEPSVAFLAAVADSPGAEMAFEAAEFSFKNLPSSSAAPTGGGHREPHRVTFAEERNEYLTASEPEWDGASGSGGSGTESDAEGQSSATPPLPLAFRSIIKPPPSAARPTR